MNRKEKGKDNGSCRCGILFAMAIPVETGASGSAFGSAICPSGWYSGP